MTCTVYSIAQTIVMRSDIASLFTCGSMMARRSFPGTINVMEADMPQGAILSHHLI